MSSFPGVEYGKLHYRVLERHKIFSLKINRGNYKACITVIKTIKDQLRWWINNLNTQKSDVSKPNPSIVLSSDASDSGWGATSLDSGQFAGGRWKLGELVKHINYRELLAAFFALKSFCSSQRNVHIKILMDNTTAISYLNNMACCKSLFLD